MSSPELDRVLMKIRKDNEDMLIGELLNMPPPSLNGTTASSPFYGQAPAKGLTLKELTETCEDFSQRNREFDEKFLTEFLAMFPGRKIQVSSVLPENTVVLSEDLLKVLMRAYQKTIDNKLTEE